MKWEQDLVRELGAPLEPASPADVLSGRRVVRLASDVLLLDGLRTNTLPPLVEGCCGTMLALARVLNRHQLEPDVPHFIEAAGALIEDARTIFDAGFRVDDKDKAMVGAVMLEITVRGICAALSVPYEDAMRASHAGLPLPVKTTGAHDGNEHAHDAANDAAGGSG